MTPSRTADLTPRRKKMFRLFVEAVRAGYDFHHVRLSDESQRNGRPQRFGVLPHGILIWKSSRRSQGIGRAAS
jgi:hypothetical protein